MVKTHRKGADIKLSEHFHLSEMDCLGKECCEKTLVDTNLIVGLEMLRLVTGPIEILSGYRCYRHNLEEHGCLNSQHTFGRAADITTPLSPYETYSLAIKVPDFCNGGCGLYEKRGFIHVDTRGVRARWTANG